VYQVDINKGIILRCTAYQISSVASCWLVYLNRMMMHGLGNIKRRQHAYIFSMTSQSWFLFQR